jgi:hypothetical protein
MMKMNVLCFKRLIGGANEEILAEEACFVKIKANFCFSLTKIASPF